MQTTVTSMQEFVQFLHSNSVFKEGSTSTCNLNLFNGDNFRWKDSNLNLSIAVSILDKINDNDIILRFSFNNYSGSSIMVTQYANASYGYSLLGNFMQHPLVCGLKDMTNKFESVYGTNCISTKSVIFGYSSINTNLNSPFVANEKGQQIGWIAGSGSDGDYLMFYPFTLNNSMYMYKRYTDANKICEGGYHKRFFNAIRVNYDTESSFTIYPTINLAYYSSDENKCFYYDTRNNFYDPKSSTQGIIGYSKIRLSILYRTWL